MNIRLLPSVMVMLFTLLTIRAGHAQTPPPTNQPQSPALTAPQGKVARPPGPVDITQEPIVKIVANVQPAVVNIAAQGTVPAYVTNQYFQLYRGSRAAQSIGSG